MKKDKLIPVLTNRKRTIYKGVPFQENNNHYIHKGGCIEIVPKGTHKNLTRLPYGDERVQGLRQDGLFSGRRISRAAYLLEQARALLRAFNNLITGELIWTPKRRTEN